MDKTVEALRTETKQDRSVETVEKIKTAATEVYYEVGRDRFTTAMVAARADVSIGTLYRYFEDRVALLDAIAPERPFA